MYVSCMLKMSFDFSKIELSLQDGPNFMAEEAKLFSYPFPYLYDEVRNWQSPLAFYLDVFFLSQFLVSNGFPKSP